MMRNLLLLFVLSIGLYSFQGSKEERDAYIVKCIEDRVKEAKMDIKDIRIVKVQDISERTFTDYVVEDGILAISERIPHTYTLSQADPDWEKNREEKLSKLSNEKGYGYFVRIKCYLDGDGFPAGKRTMQFVVSQQSGTDLAMRGGWASSR